MKHGFLLPCIVLTVGCASAEGVARTRAANEFACPEDQVVVTELGHQSVLVDACGHRATYTCPRDGSSYRRVCIREAPAQ